MRSVKFLVAAGAASLLSSAAFAADMPIAPPPMYAPPPVEDFGGWYLRGDIGFSNQRVKHLDTPGYHDPRYHRSLDHRTRIRYRRQLRSRCRLSVQQLVPRRRHRAVSRQIQLPRARHRQVPTAASLGTDELSGSKSEWLVMANAYADLGTWWCVTPFSAPASVMSRPDFRFRPTSYTPPTQRGLRPMPANGISPGRCMQVLATKSRRP